MTMSFPGPALAMVERMQAAAAAEPARAIAFQGSPGANSHRAAGEAAPDYLPLPCFSFEDALEAVKDGRAACAIIPIENSQHGRVADIHFLLPESGLSIVGEYFMPISHALMAVPHADGTLGPFSAAYSHPQALGQSRRFLRDRGIVPLSHADTAGAAAYVAERADPTVAAIAPRLAADLYGLAIAEDRVEGFSPREFARHMAVNVAAPVLLAERFARSGGGGDRLVVNLLDAKLAAPNPDFLSYTLSKMALGGFTELAARALAGKGIRVNGIAPALMLRSPGQSAENFAAMHARNPLGRGVDPADVVAALRYLVDARTVTGQTIVIDGGQRFLALERDVQHLES